MSYIERVAKAEASQELSPEELAYYARHILLPGIGTVGQRKLKAARVLVVGAGGLGCPALQALAGAGVGHLTVIDGDSVSISNLSRQWLHRYGDAGRNKAESAAETLRSSNPFIEISAIADMLSSENALALVQSHDVVVDATDDLAARYWIDDACAQANVPWVHAALYRDNAQLTVFWASYDARFRRLYPELSVAPSCSGAGMLGAVASVVGNLQALECVKLIIGHASPSVGKLSILDAAGGAQRFFQLPGVSQPERVENTESLTSMGILPETLQQAMSIHQPIAIWDLRSRSAYEASSIDGAEHYPAERILEEGLPQSVTPQQLLYCEEGVVSAMLVEALEKRSPSRLEHLEGGFAAWMQSI